MSELLIRELLGIHASVALMGVNKNKSNLAELTSKSKESKSVKPQAVLSASNNPKAFVELSAKTLEQKIQPKLTKPKSLVQLAAEKIEQSIKKPAKLPKPSKLLPTLKTLGLQALVRDKINHWENKANENASIITLDKKRINIADMREDELAKSGILRLHAEAHFRICLKTG